ncbi:unnamed protein product, partial [Mesorhabditis belari]|uniref:Equilibrative nucleoside transporter 1 n=1 Tax=Mesorhabditis belari TaxID=2138241 RepID=A0AAF3EVU6_9BILA
MFYEPGTSSPPPPEYDPKNEKRKFNGFSRSETVEPFIEGTETAPKDRNGLVWWIFLLHGIGVLMPWNMYITIAHNYFEGFKLWEWRNATLPLKSDNASSFSLHPTEESRVFLHWMTICSQTPNLVLNCLNIFIPIRGDLTRRITISISIVGLVVLLTDLLVFVDTSTWVTSFFYLTLILIALLNGANGIYQSSIYGVVSDFPFKYTNAVIIGNNFCGTFVTILNILAVLVSSNPQYQAFVFFTISLFTIGLCYVSFFGLKYQEFYRYYSGQGIENRQQNCQGIISLTEYKRTIKEGWIQFVNVFLIFFVTLSLFPAVMMNVKPNAPKANGEFDYDFIFPKDQYVNISCFLLFNVFAFIGSMLASATKPLLSPKVLTICCWIRLLLIPAIVMCNYQPLGKGGARRKLAIWILNPWAYMSLAMIMSLSSGYFSSLAMMYAPRVVDSSRARLAGMISAFILICGVVAGLWFSVILAQIVLW